MGRDLPWGEVWRSLVVGRERPQGGGRSGGGRVGFNGGIFFLWGLCFALNVPPVGVLCFLYPYARSVLPSYLSFFGRQYSPSVNPARRG